MRALFGGCSFLDFLGQVLVPTPAEQDQRDVEQKGGYQYIVARSGLPGKGIDSVGQHRAAGAREHQDRQYNDGAGQHIPAHGYLVSVLHQTYMLVGYWSSHIHFSNCYREAFTEQFSISG